jgi:hypothetical protein
VLYLVNETETTKMYEISLKTTWLPKTSHHQLWPMNHELFWTSQSPNPIHLSCQAYLPVHVYMRPRTKSYEKELQQGKKRNLNFKPRATFGQGIPDQT